MNRNDGMLYHTAPGMCCNPFSSESQRLSFCEGFSLAGQWQRRALRLSQDFLPMSEFLFHLKLLASLRHLNWGIANKESCFDADADAGTGCELRVNWLHDVARLHETNHSFQAQEQKCTKMVQHQDAKPLLRVAKYHI